jgi:4-azaleucine resistance transporter AzlC
MTLFAIRRLPELMNSPSPNTKFSAAVLKEGIAAAWPVCLGYAAVGLAFGVIAGKAGLRPLEVGLMSLLVYAGSSQFIAAAMIGSGVGVVPIVLTTFVVNLRHLLMSSSLSIYLRELNTKQTALFAYGITDESFAVNSARFREGNWGWQAALVVNHVSNLAWVLSTIAGSLLGNFVPDGALGIDYALTAMFICLLVFQLRNALQIFVALLSGALAVAIALLIPGNYHVIIASFAAATVGLIVRRRKIPGTKS